MPASLTVVLAFSHSMSQHQKAEKTSSNSATCSVNFQCSTMHCDIARPNRLATVCDGVWMFAMCWWYVIFIFYPICFYSSAEKKSPKHVVEIMFVPVPISSANCVDVCSLNKRWVSKWNKHHRKLTRGCSTPAAPNVLFFVP